MAQLPRRSYQTEDFILGVSAAAFSKTLAAPLERAKLIVQCQSELRSARGQWVNKHLPFQGLRDVLWQVPMRQGGIRTLWRGNWCNILRIFPTISLNMALGETFRSVFVDPLNELGEVGESFPVLLAANVASGGLAAAAALTVVYPLDLARTRLALDMGRSASLVNLLPGKSPASSPPREYSRQHFPFGRTFGLVRDIAAQRGWFGKGGVYHGFSLAVTGAMIYRGVAFGLYRTLAMDVDDQRLDHSRRRGNEGGAAGFGFWAKFCIGYAAAATASLVAYPWDTAMRVIMMHCGSESRHVKYRHGRQCIRKIIDAHGIAGIYRGAGINLLRSLNAALGLVLFDYLQAAYVTRRRYGQFGERH